jgi:undecaprenyl pyrophosphate synthase
VETITPEEKNLEQGSVGKDYEKPVGHYTNLSHALKKIAKSKLDLKSEYATIMDYINEWQHQQDEMNKLLDKIGL